MTAPHDDQPNTRAVKPTGQLTGGLRALGRLFDIDARLWRRATEITSLRLLGTLTPPPPAATHGPGHPPVGETRAPGPDVCVFITAILPDGEPRHVRAFIPAATPARDQIAAAQRAIADHALGREGAKVSSVAIYAARIVA
ncbi:hypothetical protein [uncultured Maritimibacter sp.]|jgi:hypothetical protein|uniref:hypothetical protein n=1 Tax=uncultured Maritimibacter sp. TaxID=991866 RepID=UPI0026034261|nr:hypothetical protein [uncultured Maritimibacter sp.]